MDLKKRYGRLTVIGRVERVKNNYRVRVRCDCGVETFVWVHNMKSGATDSCGCKKAEQVAERLKKQAAERARETTDRIEAEKQLEKLKRRISHISWNSETISNVTDRVPDKINDAAKEIKAAARREYYDKWQSHKDLLDEGDISEFVFNRDTGLWYENCEKIEQEVDEERERLKAMWEKISSRARRRGKKAMLRARQATEALFTRVQARSMLVALRKFNAGRGKIAQRLFAPVQAAQEALQCWLAANPREREGRLPRESAGIVLDPAALSVGFPVAAG
jgi:hypothetical protein